MSINRVTRAALVVGFGPAIRAIVASVLVTAAFAPIPASAQRIVKSPEQVVSVSKGASALIVNPGPLQRFSVGDPSVAEAVAVSPTEVLVNGKTVGVTSLFLWDNAGVVQMYSIEVTADAAGLQRYLAAVLPGEKIDATATGNIVTLSGQVRDASVASRAVEIAKGSGAVIVDNLTIPDATQVLLHVRFAEVNRSATKQFQSQIRVLNPQDLSDNGRWTGATNTTNVPNPLALGPTSFAEGVLDFGLFNGSTASLEALIRALKTRGDFRSLAEPTLVALPNHEASFLAGGEFPYPSIQGGGGNNAVTIVFKEFGIKLKFTPVITRNGSIRLKVAPEVSALDFANALVFQGFTVPALLTRKAETEVEMREGQHLSIAGLLDNSLIDNVSKIPVLGDIPILGQFFRSKDARQRRTELLVIITPKLVQPSNVADALPTGEPATWKWDGYLKGMDSTKAGAKDSLQR
ncbi:MAG TPA: type II and III secretion system protein family protein [Gemmatimonadales bacterium]|nr:type II and III secretion system protein family protein [Gemmatimonadales bacterium]